MIGVTNDVPLLQAIFLSANRLEFLPLFLGEELPTVVSQLELGPEAIAVIVTRVGIVVEVTILADLRFLPVVLSVH